MSKKPNRRRRQRPVAGGHGGRQAAPGGAPTAPAPDGLRAWWTQWGAVAPPMVILLAVLVDWWLALNRDGWNFSEDISIFMFMGQRLVEGSLNWVDGFYDNKLLVTQFLFWLPALFGSYKVWLLMSMGACLLGAYAVHAMLREVFAPARGFASELGRTAGLYSAACTLYLLSDRLFEPHHISSPAVCMALVAAALMTRHAKRPSETGRTKAAGLFLLACFCGSLAVGLRPYLAGVVGLIPVWAAVSAQLDKTGDRIDYLATAKLVVLWGAGVSFFVLGANLLPYVALGEMGAFLDGLGLAGQEIAYSTTLDWILLTLNSMIGRMQFFTALLCLCWMGFLALFLVGLLNGFRRRGLYHRAVVLDLLALTLAAPLAIMVLFFFQNFWGHYLILFMPFISIGAIALFALIYSVRPRYFDLPIRYQAITILLAALLAFGPGSGLVHRAFPSPMAPTVQSLNAVLEKHGLGPGDFLAPHNMYVHVKLNQHRHGFPNLGITNLSVFHDGYRNAPVPARYRVPTSFQEYCQLLDEHGPKLIVFFRYTPWEGFTQLPGHLSNCRLRQYQRYEVGGRGRAWSDVTHYFLRRG